MFVFYINVLRHPFFMLCNLENISYLYNFLSMNAFTSINLMIYLWKYFTSWKHSWS